MFKKIKNWVYRYINNIKAKINRRKYIALNKAKFKKDFGIKTDRVKLLMDYLEKKTIPGITNEELVISAEKYNKGKKGVAFFYEPEIIEIHNENLYGKIGMSVKELTTAELKEDKRVLVTQEDVLKYMEKFRKEKKYGNRPKTNKS